MGKKRALVVGLALIGAVAVAGMGLADVKKGPCFAAAGFTGRNFRHMFLKGLMPRWRRLTFPRRKWRV